MVHAVFPGSFDPVTHGHIDIIARASSLFSSVTVAVLDHPQKSGFFSVPERLELLREEVDRIGVGRIQVEAFSGLLVDYMKQREAKVIIRGLRAISDYDYEVQMALMNKRLSEEVETIFLVAREANSFISSTIVRQIATLGGDISMFVPRTVEKAVHRKIALEAEKDAAPHRSVGPRSIGGSSLGERSLSVRSKGRRGRRK